MCRAIAKRALQWFLFLGLAASLGACDDGTAQKCTPGESKSCVGVAGCNGGQACSSDGTGYGACDCGGVMDGGPGSDGGPLPDGGHDAGPGDAGLAPCNPVAQTGCKVGERCTWLITSDTTGQFTCFPDGTVAQSGPCTTADAGGMTALDDCARGLACVGGTCQLLCTQSPDSCPTNYVCQLYSGLFDTYGACDATCDPLTQVRNSDGAEACGSVDPVTPSLGCYSNGSGSFICAKAGDPSKTSDVPAAVGGVVYLNACAPGFLPVLYASTADPVTVICVALCAPDFTSDSRNSHAAGLSPHSCPDRGAAAPHECHYWWQTQDLNQGLDQYSNTLGLCMDYTQYQFDSDGDGVPDSPYPSCTALSETAITYDKSGTLPDNIYFGCGPHP